MSTATLQTNAVREGFRYPESIREAFIATPGLNFRDGSYVSSEKMWEFLTVEAPRRFPYSFSEERIFGESLHDYTYFAGIKHNYLNLTLRDRLLKAHANGVPIIHVQGGQTVDPFFAAGAIPVVPGPLRGWATSMKEGLTLYQAGQRATDILEAGRSAISVDCCNNPVGAMEAIRQNLIPIDMVVPYLALRCTDIAYTLESYRTLVKDIPLHFIDYPVTRDTEWTVQYVAELLRDLVKRIAQLRGVEVTEEDLWKEIKLENRGRKFARDAVELVWRAELPPIRSQNLSGIITGGRFDRGDSLAGTELLEQDFAEVTQRVRDGVLAPGVSEDAVRLISVGSCFGLQSDFVEAHGGVVVGTDDHLSKIYADVGEYGDPYERMAESILSYNYEKETEKRAAYVVDLVRRSRANGVVCGYNWGCNYQSAVSRMIADIVKKETGVPTLNLVVNGLGLSRLQGNEQTQNRIESFIEMIRH
ncbi:2-hydroxyglutaryl-CoA dehydratase D-component [Rhodomicrobium vannielii ATCC 17100]|uniref:2-hydroxyglutaryl-CoA dehydratase D-component n=1 Tax=Rhodomicrobium vannielii (strain ATCC 17100 / DSM 162 / LMG 4299 / NCIMB 10020 / ATH 3.1.1) TaxID=648757 RepID=E3I4W4_RHOVT|nr:2-hydroxyacyl-CoA dehydratase family protein [Rhodomicrobium vannielii]ADP72786.1 2-hydroxyglutaryl-CoA dehydratase D-component [Rhodomicrobium vannielii ATCC 17100]